MRPLILTLILMIFSAQSLALAVAPACDHQGMGMQGGAHGAAMLSADHDHAGDGMAAGAHSDMPCCKNAVDFTADDLCQLTCAAGGCGAVALFTSEWQLSPVPAIPAFLPISPSPLAASQRNLLRPPIGA